MLACLCLCAIHVHSVIGQKLNLSVPDFQVNENAGSSAQMNSDVASGINGNFICVWEDARNEGGYLEGMFGQPGGDIFAQRLDSDGNPIGGNFKVNDDATITWQLLPVIAAGGNGNFIVAWLDMRESTFDNESQHIYAQLFDADGTHLGDNFRVNEADGVAWMEKPAVAADDAGNFVIAWSGESQGEAPYEIYAQCYFADGTPMGNNFIVSSYTNRNEPRYPSVAMKGSGEFVIVFEGSGMSDQHPDIFVQRFTPDGTPLDSNIVVNVHPGEDAYVTSPLVGIDDAGNILVTWIDHRIDSYQATTFGQWFDSEGTPMGNNFNLCEEGIFLNPYELNGDLSVGADGSYCTVWYDWVTSKISARRFSGDSTAAGRQFALYEFNSGTSPSLAMNSSGKLFVAWTGSALIPMGSVSQSDIFGQCVQGDSTRLEQFMHIDDDTGSGNQLHSDIAADGHGNFTIVWEDHRDDEGDIYLRRYSEDGTALGPQLRVNNDEPGGMSFKPAVAIDSSGMILVVWEDYQSGKLAGQFFSSEGAVFDTNFVVDSEKEERYLQPDVAALGNHTFIITWQMSWNIGARIYSADSGAVGSGFTVNDVTGEFKTRDHPAVAVDDSGRFTIVWKDQRAGTDIYAQRYEHTGQPLGENIRVTSPGNWGMEPAVACKPDGTTYIVWTGQGITFQRIDASGNLVGANVPLTEPPTQEIYPMNPDISADTQGRFIITWEVGNYYSWLSSSIYGLRISSGGTAIDSTFLIPGEGALNPTDVRVALSNNRIYTTWTDNLRINTNWDVFVNVLDFDKPNGMELKSNNTLLSGYQLYQNYPNPFNPKTTIQYTVGAPVMSPQLVDLSVYNILGQKVATLVSKNQPAGNYLASWDATGFAGGLYFYQIRIGTIIQTRRMLFLK